MCALIKQARGEKSTAAPRGSDSDHLTEHDIAWAEHGSERRMKSVCCLHVKIKVASTLWRIAVKVELFSNDPRRKREMDLCLSRERYR